jgi:hypothetical protein
MTAMTYNTQHVVSELLSHTQAYSEALLIREHLGTLLEGLQTLNQILSYHVTLVSARTIEVLIVVPLEVCRDSQHLADLTQPLDALSTDTVTVAPYATFPEN